jgi:bacteriorhodopsin
LTIAALRVEALVWVLIYGGMLGTGIGIALERDGQTFGWSVVCAGAVVVLAGIVLIWIRSRMKRDSEG